MALVYVYSRLLVSLDSLAISALFEENDISLEELAETVTSIVTDNTLCNVYISSAIEDFLEMHLLKSSELSFEDVLSDFKELLEMVKLVINRPEFSKLGKLRAVHLEKPNTLILEFFSGLSVKPQNKPRRSSNYVVNFRKIELSNV